MKIYTGVVQKGTQRAAALGFPTVNIPLSDDASGIFAARVVVGDKAYDAAAFADQGRKILEAHILDANLALYGSKITIELHHKIRESAAFEGDDALRAAIEDDTRAAREYFRKTI